MPSKHNAPHESTNGRESMTAQANKPEGKTRKTPKPHSKANKGTDSKAVIAMRKGGLTVKAIADQINTTHSNVSQILKRYNIREQHLIEYEKNREKILTGIESRLLSSITPQDIKKANLSQRVLAACQIYDKGRLERTNSDLQSKPMVLIIKASNPVDNSNIMDINSNPLMITDSCKE